MPGRGDWGADGWSAVMLVVVVLILFLLVLVMGR
jgi:hypothetical protein